MESLIREYLKDVRMGEGYVALEKIGDDIYYDEKLRQSYVTLNAIVRYALNNGWSLYDDIDDGWAIEPN